MTILKTDIKLMASQRMDDTPDGGGHMSGIEIVDGNVNYMFPDISRFDRTKGRVSMRKGFVGVFTDNQDTFLGAHAVITDPADDPLIGVCMFSTDNPFDTRVEARDRIESYVAQGVRFHGYLWGKHIEGARAIALVMETGEELPGVGSLLFLTDVDDVEQYVRITKVTSKNMGFAGQSKNVVTCGISERLRTDFMGYEPTDSNKTSRSMVYRTVVADAAKYFGVMRAVSDFAKDDFNIDVDSIYTHLVPSAQTESEVTDVPAGSVPNLFASGSGSTLTVSGAQHQGPGLSNYLPMPAIPGTLTFGGGGHYFHTEGTKVIYDNDGTDVGTIDHQAGRIDYHPNINPILAGNIGSQVFQPALGGLRLGNSKVLPVLIANRGYSYVTSLTPLPTPGSVVVDYMVQGSWYRMADDGNGALRGIAGSGSINYATGALIVTCGALPDADTAIIINWGNPLEYVNRGGKILENKFVINHTVADGSINPGSLTLKWWNAGIERTATDNGTGLITGTNASGTVIYATGEIRFTPDYTPDDGSLITFDSEKFAKVIHNQLLSSGNNSFTLPSFPIKPGSLSIKIDYSGHGYTTSVTLVDDGLGNIKCEVDPITLNRPLGHSDWEGTTEITPLPNSGTIDYNTGEIFLHGTSSGLVKWIERHFKTETVEVN